MHEMLLVAVGGIILAGRQSRAGRRRTPHSGAPGRPRCRGGLDGTHRMGPGFYVRATPAPSTFVPALSTCLHLSRMYFFYNEIALQLNRYAHSAETIVCKMSGA